jgi:hypothetical protein
MTTPPVLSDVIKIQDDRSPLKAYEQTDKNEGDPIADALTIKIWRPKLGQ